MSRVTGDECFMIRTVGQKADELAKWTAVLLGFSLPLSTALDGLLLALMVLLWLLGNNFRVKYAMIRKNPVALASLVMCGIYLMGLLYGQVNKGSLSDAKTFLLIPLMITLFQEERIRRYAWWGFLSSMLLTLALSYLIFFHFLPDNLGEDGADPCRDSSDREHCAEFIYGFYGFLSGHQSPLCR